MRLYINERPRTFILVRHDYALIIRHPLPKYGTGNNVHHHHTSGPSTDSEKFNQKKKILVEFVHKEKLQLGKFRDITPGAKSGRLIHGFLGFLNIKNNIFIGVITSHTKSATPLLGEDVHTITGVRFFCLNTDEFDYISEKDDIEQSQVQGSSDKETSSVSPTDSVRRLLSSGSFFYSKEFDITSNVQERFDLTNNQRKHSTYKLSVESPYFKRFMWNSFMISEMISFRNLLSAYERVKFDECGFLTPIARGFAKSINVKSHGDHDALLTLISKQSCLKNGPLFGDWGCDDNGEVSNFVESEVVIYSESFCFAYVVVRGNVPIFWELESHTLARKNLISTKKHKKIFYPRSFEASQHAFSKHFEKLANQFGEVHVVNALSQDLTSYKGDLNAKFKEHLSYFNEKMKEVESTTEVSEASDKAVGLGMHFHVSCTDTPLSTSNYKKMGYNSTNPKDIVNELLQTIIDYGAFFYDFHKNGLTGKQLGVFRVDSFDSLRKANFICKVISQEVIQLALRDVGIEYNLDLLTKHGKLWEENDEKLKELTLNFVSTSSKLQRSSANTTKSFKSLLPKKYLSGVVDSKPNESTMLKFLGKIQDQDAVLLVTPMHQRLTQLFNERIKDFSFEREITVFASTFNVNGSFSDEGIDNWLFPKNIRLDTSYDIVFVGLQEVVELTPGHMVNTASVNRLKWVNKIKDELENNSPDSSKYVSLWDGQLGGIALLLFVKESELNNINGVEGSFKKTGLGGMSANKGGIGVRFNYSDTSFCFISSHLAAGLSNVDERHQNYKTIMKGIKFSQNRRIKDHDAVIWLGDFNYRIGLPNEQVKPLIEQAKFSKLFEYDQLNAQMSSGASFPFFNEMEITFPPTYKFDNGTKNYDTSEKQRIPAWTDRILNLSRAKILKQSIYYCDSDLVFSDHRPVFAIFKASVRIIDDAKKNSIYDSLIEMYQRDYGGITNLFFVHNDLSYLVEQDDNGSLPPPSSDLRKWWLDGGKLAKVNIPELNSQSIIDGDTKIINPKLPINPFEATTEPEFIGKKELLEMIHK